MLLTIATLMVFRIPCTVAIIVFSVYGLSQFKRIDWNNEAKWILLGVSAPFLLHVLFLWNDSSVANSIKATEKYLSLLFLPVFIIGNYRYIDFEGILKKYLVGFALVLLAMLVRYIVVFPEQFNKYMQGIHIWEMGYTFAKSFSNHAPAINMHVAFAVVSTFYFALRAFMETPRKIGQGILFLVTFVVLFFFLLYINTRLALVNALVGIGLVLAYRMRKDRLKQTALFGFIMAVVVGCGIAFFVHKNPYMIKKYTKESFAHMDKIGRLDEIDNARAVAYNSLVTRLTIWKTTLELGAKKPIVGYGSDNSKDRLFQYYYDTEQYFLSQAKLPVHNQFLDFFLKFGIVGVLALLLYFWNLFRLGRRSGHVLVLVFFMIFLVSNLSDDFLIRFDGIAYSGLWISIFASHYRKTVGLKQQSTSDEIN
ncbi:O-antigen ligase family protein [Flavobacterium caeni]|uniref:O-antigen ligase family protein n=1 Tax=Flavobacterium caeni TaxID=490189 RepID=UPI00147D989D|nr:O-antigen ligase family protein [Flavobacterium caeni]